MTAVLDAPLPDLDDLSDSQFEEGSLSWGEPLPGATIVLGGNTFVDCELSEYPAPTTFSLPAAGSYTITLVGNGTITPPDPGPLPRVPGSRKLTSEMLLDAAALMERVGLHKGDLWPGARVDHMGRSAPYEDGQPVCAWGAVLVALGVRQMSPSISIDAVLWDEHAVMLNLALLNDDPARTQAEVVAELRRRAGVLYELQNA